jgi:hypothetical protein
MKDFNNEHDETRMKIAMINTDNKVEDYCAMDDDKSGAEYCNYLNVNDGDGGGSDDSEVTAKEDVSMTKVLFFQ